MLHLNGKIHTDATMTPKPFLLHYYIAAYLFSNNLKDTSK